MGHPHLNPLNAPPGRDPKGEAEAADDARLEGVIGDRLSVTRLRQPAFAYSFGGSRGYGGQVGYSL